MKPHRLIVICHFQLITVGKDLQTLCFLKAKWFAPCFSLKFFRRDFPAFDYPGMAVEPGVAELVEFLPHTADMHNAYQCCTPQ